MWGIKLENRMLEAYLSFYLAAFARYYLTEMNSGKNFCVGHQEQRKASNSGTYSWKKQLLLSLH